jgi:hypothetical protein
LWPISKVNFWFIDEEGVYNKQAEVLDFLIDVLF